jgi:hypothetical protein
MGGSIETAVRNRINSGPLPPAVTSNLARGGCRASCASSFC